MATEAGCFQLTPSDKIYPPHKSAFDHWAFLESMYRSTSARAASSGTCSPVTGCILAVRPSQRVNGVAVRVGLGFDSIPLRNCIISRFWMSRNSRSTGSGGLISPRVLKCFSSALASALVLLDSMHGRHFEHASLYFHDVRKSNSFKS
uniref:Uncharacterized protein n=1 Tax=Candidatus Kentrum sp. MB TaxID=2138164 RepID=A0A450XQB0_9GAMM|nr:MAG: hypothetical protein BECKMB1821G_GA0114241_101219 [Candidatus Kentron sp. MB]VFK31501.1 MAG: hypothetical protein BECKMB1821I_GA0114274_102415 [Candidatus Kentron sp. MB]VFK75539.1 MAG: hypothetical protein BECKMB1821H_GA0114242_102514 [Candidatus Kentron sp. MB]